MAKTKTASEKITLTVQPRTEFGKQLRKYKYLGLVAGNIFGADYKSHAITVPLKELQRVYKLAKETAVIYLQLDKTEVPVLIRSIQKNPVKGFVLHVDFRKINLKEKIETTVPVEITGESIAVTQQGGVLLKQADHLMVEALPQDIPATIAIDISTIKEVGGEIKVGDLPKSSTYEIKEEADKVIVSVTEHKEESVEVQKEAVATEITSERPDENAEGEEGAAPAGDDKKE